MKIKSLSLLGLGVLAGFAINAIAQQPIQRQLPNVVEFEIELKVDRAKNGVRMTCLEGCRWKTLSFACNPNGPDCEKSFDEAGTPAQ